MLNFVCILAIILELILTTICVIEINKLLKRVDDYTKQLDIVGIAVIKISKNIKNTVVNLNKVVKILTNKKLINSYRIIKMTIDIVQVIILIKSLDLSKGLKSINYHNIKKLMFTEITRRFLTKFVLKCIRAVSI